KPLAGVAAPWAPTGEAALSDKATASAAFVHIGAFIRDFPTRALPRRRSLTLDFGAVIRRTAEVSTAETVVDRTELGSHCRLASMLHGSPVLDKRGPLWRICRSGFDEPTSLFGADRRTNRLAAALALDAKGAGGRERGPGPQSRRWASAPAAGLATRRQSFQRPTPTTPCRPLW